MLGSCVGAGEQRILACQGERTYVGFDDVVVGLEVAVVMAALAGRSVLMISPTGSGKSLCFQLPAILRPGTAYVISPLMALMADQISALQRRKLPGTFINGDLSRDDEANCYRLVTKSAFKFLYVAPERFCVEEQAEVRLLVGLRPSVLVVDEAHCIDWWGSDFRPDYGRLGEVRKAIGQPPVLAFTASAGLEAQKRILESLGIPDAEVIVRGVDRPSIGFVRRLAVLIAIKVATAPLLL